MSHRKVEGSINLEVSRRIFIAGATAPAFAGQPVTIDDSSIGACEAWLSRNTEADRLQAIWSKLEDDLVRHHRWYKLTERQRCQLPAGQELFDIDERFHELDEERAALLGRLISLQATTSIGLAGKLAVAATIVSPDDNEDAHNLISSILRDLRMMQYAR